MNTIKFLILFLAVAGLFGVSLVADATHAWGTYHWARTQNPFTLQLGDNVSGVWDGHLATVSEDWSKSDVLDTVIVSGAGGKTCKATTGRVEVCSSKYGRNNWLGLASIWVSGSHIVKGTVKVNDTYFAMPAYNTPAWRNLVLCHEVGHTLGLDHQDEDFTNEPLGTCMDYSSDPTPNQHPNQHDYDMLETIYEHLDTTTTVRQTFSSAFANADLDAPGAWGREIRTSKDGRASLYVRDFGAGNKIFTFVFWEGFKNDRRER